MVIVHYDVLEKLFQKATFQNGKWIMTWLYTAELLYRVLNCSISQYLYDNTATFT